MLTLIVVLAWLFVVVRLAAYRRAGARYRFWVSAGAVALMFGAFSRVVALAVEQAPLHWSEALIAVATAALVFRARGNFACVLRGRS